MDFWGRYINLDYFFYKIYQVLAWVWGLIFGAPPAGSSGDSSSGFFSDFYEKLNSWKMFLEFLTVLLLTGIIYCLVRLYEIEKAERRRLDIMPVAIDEAPYENKRWEVVLSHADSDSSSDWRLAIIEADNMLDEMVKKLGYEGEDLGERLKAVEASDFESLQSAWEAHKARNQIVHEGVGFELTKRETERVIQLYEKVFREFHYI